MRYGQVLAPVMAAALAAACGSSGSPTNATPSGVPVPTNFRITQQQVTFTSNIVQVAWDGTASSYTFQAGTTSGASDVFSTDVTGTTYTWTAARDGTFYYIRVIAKQGGDASKASTELPVYTIDLRDVIDALFFHAGPMADTPDAALSDPQAGVWADGTQLSILVSNEATASARSAADIFTADYASLSSRGITATSSMTSDDMHGATLSTVPIDTIDVRVLTGFCGSGALACAFYGPAPIGPNRSIATMNAPNTDPAIAHEIGHAYGLGHVHVNGAVRPELNFLMNPVLLSTQMTDPEKTAIRTALAAGVRAGWTRSQALAAGLVRPYPSATPTPAVAARLRGSDPARCTVGGGVDQPAIR